MAGGKAAVEIISNPLDPKFTNANVGDLAIFTKTQAQKIHIGGVANGQSAVCVTSQNVTIAQPVQAKDVTMRGVIRLSN